MSTESSRPGEVFDRVAQAYDDVRSGYSPTLVEAALECGRLGAGSRAVEVGCGTGKLTELLVARGLRVDAVDPGPRMIEVARRRVGRSSLARFHLGRFEDVELLDGSFEAVFSATAFHWVDPAVGWRKAARLLRPGGVLALIAHRPVADDDSAALDAGFRELWAAFLPESANPWPALRPAATVLGEAEALGANISEVWDSLGDRRHGLAVAEAAKLFGETTVLAETQLVEETAERSIALLRTTSTYFRIDEQRRPSFEDGVGRLFERLGGAVRFPLMTVLALAPRADG